MNSCMIVYSFLSTPAGRLLFNYFERRLGGCVAAQGDDVHGSGMHEMEICSAFFPYLSGCFEMKHFYRGAIHNKDPIFFWGEAFFDLPTRVQFSSIVMTAL